MAIKNRERLVNPSVRAEPPLKLLVRGMTIPAPPKAMQKTIATGLLKLL